MTIQNLSGATTIVMNADNASGLTLDSVDITATCTSASTQTSASSMHG